MKKNNLEILLFQSMKFISYINTNEIPGELSRENMISLFVKITCYFRTWKDQRSGYIFQSNFDAISEWRTIYLVTGI